MLGGDGYELDPELIRRAQALIERHPHFRGRADQFQFECVEHALVVRGKVPTYYLKQLVQSALMEMDHCRVDNRIEVLPTG